jgi:hypothetical protein
MLALGASVATSTAAIAGPSTTDAALSVTVNPATDLDDQAVVSVSIAGFAAGQEVYVLECAQPAEGVDVCDFAGSTLVVADESGSATTSLTAKRTFEAVTQDGSPWGTVNCDAVAGGCGIVAGADPTTWAVAGISFKG